MVRWTPSPPGESGLTVHTGRGELVRLGAEGSVAWTRQTAREPVGMTSQDRILYRSTTHRITATDGETNTTLWAVDTAVVGDLTIADERLLVSTIDGLLALDVRDVSVDWDLMVAGGGSIGAPVVAYGQVATIEYRPVVAGGQLEEYSVNTLRVLDLEDGEDLLSYSFGAGS